MAGAEDMLSRLLEEAREEGWIAPRPHDDPFIGGVAFGGAEVVPEFIPPTAEAMQASAEPLPA